MNTLEETKQELGARVTELEIEVKNTELDLASAQERQLELIEASKYSPESVNAKEVKEVDTKVSTLSKLYDNLKLLLIRTRTKYNESVKAIYDRELANKRSAKKAVYEESLKKVPNLVNDLEKKYIEMALILGELGICRECIDTDNHKREEWARVSPEYTKALDRLRTLGQGHDGLGRELRDKNCLYCGHDTVSFIRGRYQKEGKWVPNTPEQVELGHMVLERIEEKMKRP